MSLFDEPQEEEAVNALEYFQALGLTPEQAVGIVLHMLLTQSYVLEGDARRAAADLGIPIPYVHPGDGRMH